MQFSDYIVYADASGDHGLISVDPEYPVFVLCFCVFRISDYISEVVPRVQRLKFRFFGHDAVVLHGHEIRKSRGPFKILFDQEERREFMEAVNQVIDASPFTLIAAVIDKRKLRDQYAHPDSPYEGAGHDSGAATLSRVSLVARAFSCVQRRDSSRRMCRDESRHGSLKAAPHLSREQDRLTHVAVGGHRRGIRDQGLPIKAKGPGIRRGPKPTGNSLAR